MKLTDRNELDHVGSMKNNSSDCKDSIFGQRNVVIVRVPNFMAICNLHDVGRDAPAPLLEYVNRRMNDR